MTRRFPDVNLYLILSYLFAVSIVGAGGCADLKQEMQGVPPEAFVGEPVWCMELINTEHGERYVGSRYNPLAGGMDFSCNGVLANPWTDGRLIFQRDQKILVREEINGQILWKVVN